MEKILGEFQNGYFSPPPARNIRGHFSYFHPENLVGFLKVKPMKVGPVD